MRTAGPRPRCDLVRRYSKRADHNSANSGTNCAADVDAHTVDGNRRSQGLLGNQLRHDRLPCRRRQSHPYCNQEREQQQCAGSDQAERTSVANIADNTVVALSPTMRNRRLSTMSASAPAGIANRNMGRLVATWTSDTDNGSAFRPVINQPQAPLYIQVPTFATTVATQMTAKTRYRNGLHSETTCSVVRCWADFFAPFGMLTL
jgi:hypothetical protein